MNNQNDIVKNESFKLVKPALTYVVKQLKRHLPNLPGHHEVLNILARTWGYSCYKELRNWIRCVPLCELYFRFSYEKLFNELKRYGCDDEQMEDVFYYVFQSRPFLAEKKLLIEQGVTLDTFFLHDDGVIREIRGNPEIAFEGFKCILLRRRINLIQHSKRDEFYFHKKGVYATSFDFIDYDDIERQYKDLQKFLNYFNKLDSTIPFLLASHLMTEGLSERLLNDKAWKYFDGQSIYGRSFFMWKAEKALLKHVDD